MVTKLEKKLFELVEEGNDEQVRAFLDEYTVNLNAREEDGQTVLMIASKKGLEKVVDRLLSSHEVDVNAVDNDDWSALLNGARSGYAAVVEMLLEAGANVEQRDMAGWTALMWACYKGHFEVVKLLLENHANPNVKGEHHMSCLTWAAGRGHSDIVILLLTFGAKVNTSDKYGTTPLIWAARKGHYDAVLSLLKNSAQVDKAGMNSWTALIAAAAGGYGSVCSLILEHNPNVNAIDKDGMTALAVAAKEGAADIVSMLLNHGAYSNITDKLGDTALIHSSKNNHLECVRHLVKKYANLDSTGFEHKTALYWAVDKGNVVIARLLLDHSANVEIANKEGETPLLKAVRSRNLEMVSMLVDKGAKASATDKRGDNSLHLALRSRSKRIAEVLLSFPKNYKLLHIKNSNGETAYAVDAAQEKSILTQVFGAKNLNTDDNLQGYEVYSASIADVLSEPSLRTPITVGLFARWGSGKSSMIKMLRSEMETYSSYNYDNKFSLSFIVFFVITVLCLIIFLCFLFISWFVALPVALGLWVFLIFFYGLLWWGSQKRSWSWMEDLAWYLCKQASFISLLCRLIFCNVPEQKFRNTAPISFIFTENARLNTIMAERCIFSVVAALAEAVEVQYGVTIARLYKIFRPRKASEYGKFKTLCCIPTFLILLTTLALPITAFILFYFFRFDTSFSQPSLVTNSVILVLLGLAGLVLLGNTLTWYKVIAAMLSPSSKTVRKIASKTQSDGQNLDAVVPLIKKEVDNMGIMVRSMDAFSNRHTRMVVVVDGLDSCEQDKLLNVLDLVNLLFNQTSSPFVIILSVDPHVIIRGIEHNINSQFRDSSINGYDYLRNIVQLPFYIHNQVIPKPPARNVTKSDINQGGEHPLAQYHKQDGMTGASYISLNEAGKTTKARRRKLSSALNASTNLIRQPSIYDLSRSLNKTAYFSDINPRNMKRLMNILALTSRLLRAFGVDFNWYKLVSWINLTEQWPYRLSWVILQAEDDELDATLTIKNVYERVKDKIPSSKDIDPLVEIDRNVRKLEVFLSNSQPSITVADVRRFLPCTINIDPYLRKLIKELQQNNENMMLGGEMLGGLDARNWPSNTLKRSITSTAQLFKQSTVPPVYMPSGYPPYFYYPPPNLVQLLQESKSPIGTPHSPKLQLPVPIIKSPLVKKPIDKLTTSEVCEIVCSIEGINQDMCTTYSQLLTNNNINGFVLSSCDLNDLKTELAMKFGDWVLFKRAVESMRSGAKRASENFDDDSVFSFPQFQNNRLNDLKQRRQNKLQGFKQPQQQYPHQQKQQQYQQIQQYQQQQAFQPIQSQQQQQYKQQKLKMSQKELQSQLSQKFPSIDENICDEVLIETEALLNIVDAAGVDSDDEENEEVTSRTNISPIPEEDSRHSPIPSTSGVTFQNDSTGNNNVGDRVFFMGPDQDSGDSDSEEVTRLSNVAKRNQNEPNKGVSDGGLDKTASPSNVKFIKTKLKSSKENIGENTSNIQRF